MTIVATPGKISPLYPEKADIFSHIAGTAAEKGQALIQGTDGRFVLGNAGTAATAGGRGIALTKAGAGQAVDVLYRGHVGGYELGTVAYDAPVYMSNADGGLGTAAGSVSKLVGRVVALSDRDRTKCIYFDFDWT